MEIKINEELLSTTNTKLAAVLLMFGVKLRQHQPLEWNDIYPNKAAYWENKIDPKRCKPHSQVTFHFEVKEFGREAIQKIVEAYELDRAESEFDKVLEGLNNQEKIQMAHSRAVARACRESLEAREYLVHLIFSVSEDCKWDIIKGNGSGEVVKLGKNCSDELREEFLARISS